MRGAALASDAFFPFDDCVKACAEAGISCIIQPGGSVRDQDSIDACDRYGIAMVFTGMRHFKHEPSSASLRVAPSGREGRCFLR